MFKFLQNCTQKVKKQSIGETMFSFKDVAFI